MLKKINWRWFRRAALPLILGLIILNWNSINASTIERTLDQLRLVAEVFTYIQRNYVEDVDTQKLVYGAAHGMMRTLDPFSQFMEPKAHEEMKTETEGHFGGIGTRIEMKNGWLTVMTPIPNTPAYRAGVMPGDVIIKIEKESTENITLEQAVEKLRGKPGSKVNITVVHEGEKEPLEISLVREVIKIDSVYSYMLEDKIGYVRLTEFINKSDTDMLKALEDLKKEGMDSLVLDLRFNPGGLLPVAIEVSKLFIGDNKLIVYTEGRASPRFEARANSNAPFANLPMVVLVNGGSASGSEIVAGALQDHKRALLVGTTTFGKASVQSVIPLSDGSGLRLTTAKYYTPLGRAIMRNEKTGTGGIAPDVFVDVNREQQIKIRRQQELIYAKGKKSHSVIKQEDQVEDSPLQRAVELLKATKILHP